MLEAQKGKDACGVQNACLLISRRPDVEGAPRVFPLLVSHGPVDSHTVVEHAFHPLLPLVSYTDDRCDDVVE